MIINIKVNNQLGEVETPVINNKQKKQKNAPRKAITI